MKAFNYKIIDKRDDSQLDSGLVVAEDFDTARTAALDQAKEDWPGISLDISSIESLKGRVLLAPSIAAAEARA